MISKLQNQLKQGHEQIQNLKRKLNHDNHDHGKGKDKGRGKGKNKNRRGNGERERTVPSAVAEMERRGLETRTKGEPICFAYNSPSGCPNASPGQRCNKGWHVCAHKSCRDRREPHAATTH